MKKLFAIILVLAMALTLWACSLFRKNDVEYTPLTPGTQDKSGNTELVPNSSSTPDASVSTDPTEDSKGGTSGSSQPTAGTTAPTKKPPTQPTTPTTAPTTAPTTDPAVPPVIKDDSDISLPID